MSDEKETGKPDEEKKNSAPEKGFGDEIELFVKQIDALAETLPLAMIAIGRVRVTSQEQLHKFLREECKPVSHKDGMTTYRFEGGQYLKHQRFLRRRQKAELAMMLVPRGLLVALVSQFDAYVGALIRQLFKSRPEILDSSQKPLTLSQLIECGSVEAAKEFVIDKEIESVLRESHNDQFNWLESKLGITLRKGLSVWPAFIELTERRNLFVHTNGVVSRQYLEVCRRHSCQIPADIGLGDSLPITREYFGAACDCLLEIGVKLGQVIWRKIQPAEMKKADENLVVTTYTMLSEGRYQLALPLLDFATETLPRLSSEDARLSCVVNRAQTYKWTGNEAKCREILDDEDWSATDIKFRLACAVLRDDFKHAIELVKQIGATDRHVEKHAYREWPLFREFRKSAEFAAVFQEVFGEQLNTLVVKSKAEGDLSTERPN